ncbi:MAG: hypothetical protein Q9166_002785 [cf. Caloplaca sp. 2 TL-2023]
MSQQNPPSTHSSTPANTRQSIFPTSQSHSSSTHSASQTKALRARQYTHLQSQLAQLNAHLADTENLLAMTAVQAEYVRGLGGWWGGLYMASSKVLGEEAGSGIPAAGGVGYAGGKGEKGDAERE